SFRVPNQIRCDRQFAIPVTSRDTRKVVWQMNETRVPAQFIEFLCPAVITGRTGRHQCVQQEHRRRSSPCPCIRSKKIHARGVVCCKSCLDRAAPRQCCHT